MSIADLRKIMEVKKISRSTQKQLVNALKLYFIEVEGVETNFHFLLPRKSDFVLPEVLSKEKFMLS